MIYKTWFGKYIDLSKIIAISDYFLTFGDINFQICFTIDCQLLGSQIIYKNGLIEENDKVLLCSGQYGYFHDFQGNEKLKIKQIYDFQQKINELIEIWKQFKESEKVQQNVEFSCKCSDCANYQNK